MKMQEMFTRGALLSALMATLIPTAADAGLKYWTVGNYDADSYVQEGLVLNYDGIRNVGIDQPHSTTTTTWVNLANPGTHDLSFYAKTSGATTNWLDNGYLFNNGTVFREMSSNLVVPGKQTTQVLMDAKSANLSSLGYVWFPGQIGSDNTYWQTWSVSVRDKNTKQIWYNTHAYTTDRPKWNGTEFTYLTALANETYTAAFSGTEEPTSTPGRYPTKTDVVFPSRTMGSWAIGGQPNGSDSLNGSIKSFRLYYKVLTTDELVWNRSVDEYRFFGKPVSWIPVTNIVIASSIASVSGNELAGAYAVDASGYTFSAPVSKTVDGRTYTCAGYTLETWDDTTGTWGAVQTESGTSVAVTASDRVRITWQWTGGDGIVTRYTTADYVQDGLLYHYDGIKNLGADQPHSYDTTIWRNLASNGGYDLNFHVSASATEPGEWRDDGYRFERESWFSPDVLVYLPSNQTIQVALYASPLDQYAINNSGAYVNEAYIYYNTGTFNKGGSLSVRRDLRDTGNCWIDWSTHGYGGSDDRPNPCVWKHGAPFEYVTAILADGYAAAFFGTSIPANQTNRYAYNASRRTLTSNPQVQTPASPGFGIGRHPSNDNKWGLRGVVKNFRFYNRVLTNEELAQNRMVDDYRLHGIMPVTNVVVATSHSFFAGTEANGNYEISGAYTFSAPTAKQTDSRGFEYTFAGYTLETWDAAARGWSAPVAVDGASSYTYTVGTSPAKVRLTWRWNCTKALRTAADFGLEDVVPNGLVLHYDGIKNIGAECDDATNETNRFSQSWVNLANPGMYTLAREDKGTRAGCWTDCGYAFTNTSKTVGGYFKHTGNFTFNSRYSLQVLVDATATDQADATCGYLMFNSPWKAASMAIRSREDYNYAFYYVADDAYAGADARPKITKASKTYSYGTAIIDGKTATFFEGTEAPTSGTKAQGYFSSATAATATNVTSFCLGGGQAATQDFTGTLKTFRYYDRVLTTDEMVRNRNVDSARYFGALATTNVFVVAGGEGAVQSEAGAYKVDGEWTFTASKTVNKRRQTVDVMRYSTEELVNGVWANKTYHSGNTYTYTEGTSPATVRLKWLGQPLGTRIYIQ